MFRIGWLHVLALWSIAVAQPILSLLGTSPEFFVAHLAGAADILLLTLVLVVLVPSGVAAAVALSGLAGPRVRRTALSLVVATFTGLIAMQVAVRAGVTAWFIATPCRWT